MKFKKVKQIKEELSVLGLGCWGFSGGDVWDGTNDENSIKAIHAAVDAGINFYDVAPIYGFGHAEEVLGKALSNGKREKVIVASKCGLIWDKNRNVKNNLTKNSILKEIDDSLKRLNTDYLDLYQLHWPDPNTSIEETIEAIEFLKKSGKIRYFGVTNFSLKSVSKIMEMTSVDSQQGLYNMMERNPSSYHTIPLDYRTEDEVLPFCEKNGQAYLPYSPLFQGLLTGTFKLENNFSQSDVRSSNPKLNGEDYIIYYKGVEKLKEIAKEIGKPLNEIAINWLEKNPAVTSIIAGAQKAEHIIKNLKALQWELTDENLKAINEVIEPYKNL
ncbi:aldo/keto reductase AkrN [Clostridium sediminicola]|uniref:aldo/keto reductase n=1 Tax=Clostridium sediminicola TaxID=3114879 RepID=UPI0031F246D0